MALAVAGLVHGHVDGFFRKAAKRSDVRIIGISDPDPALHAKYAERHKLDPKLFFRSTEEMLEKVKPEAVASFTSTFDHPAVVEACAKKKIPVMMEKPLAVSMAHAHRIGRAASASGIPVIVNYETTWYASHRAIWRELHDRKSGGTIRRMVAMDGHQGPQEIHTPPEFFNWLTDPEKNGAGSLFDFGCYGANLMTWMMNNQRPIAVTAATRQFKPAIYANVDDDSTILVDYGTAEGIIQGSWNWPFSRKDFEVYTEHAYAIATGGNNVRQRLSEAAAETSATPEPLPEADSESIPYLLSVVRGKRKPEGLSSLENNMIVTEILTAARESARSGRKVLLARQ